MELELREVTPEVLDELRTHVVLPAHQAEPEAGATHRSRRIPAPEARP